MKPYYEHAGITIYHGDCREILPSLPACDLVLTDPPYSIQHVDGGGFASARRFYRDGALDGLCDFNLQDYTSVLGYAGQLVAFHSRDQVREYAVWINEHFGNYDLHVWHKINAIPFTCNVWKSDLEYIALGWRQKKHAVVAQIEKSKLYQSSLEVDKQHPTQKPIALWHKYLRVLQPMRVVDPFMGSGTMLTAAKEFGAEAIGIEIEEKYCEIAAKRLSQEVLQFG